jgi:hypothetical protein
VENARNPFADAPPLLRRIVPTSVDGVVQVEGTADPTNVPLSGHARGGDAD